MCEAVGCDRQCEKTDTVAFSKIACELHANCTNAAISSHAEVSNKYVRKH